MVELLDILKRETGMTREQIRRAVATGVGRFHPDTYARLKVEADERLVELFESMRAQRRMWSEVAITTREQARKLRLLIQKHSPVDSGALKRSWDDPRTVQILPDGQVEIDNPLPYARIQDLGGTIHRVSSRGRSFRIVIKPHHYVAKAIREFNATEKAGELQAELGQINFANYGQERLASLLGLAFRYLAENPKAAA